MNKEISLHGFTVVEGYVGYLPLAISQLQTVCQQKHQHKTLLLLRYAAASNPPAISKSINLHPPCTHPVKAD